MTQTSFDFNDARPSVLLTGTNTRPKGQKRVSGAHSAKEDACTVCNGRAKGCRYCGESGQRAKMQTATVQGVTVVYPVEVQK